MSKKSVVSKKAPVPEYPKSIDFIVMKPLGARVIGDNMTILCDKNGKPVGPMMQRYLRSGFIELKSSKHVAKSKAKSEE